MLEESSSRLSYDTQAASLPSRRPGAAKTYPATWKRFFDICFVLAISPIAIVLIGILALMVRRDGGPAFFLQRRIGKGGAVFHMWKLRTMVPDADAHLKAYLSENAAARAEWERTQKLAFDPRVTAIGRHLRKYSLDELPQLVNVLLGEMSVVGPRPMCPEQRDSYPGTEYYWLRPGMTGLWQVSARNMSSFAERAVYDGRYAVSVSFLVDIGILWKTVSVVFRGTGY
jgi:lipopolysaccharide/colanic/teichoic acid biosynthesis glycosyltransferase